MTTQPNLDALFARFLAKPGFATATTEVEPHDLGNGFRPDVRQTWADARLALSLFGLGGDKAAAPAEWATYVGTGSSAAVPLAAGFVPQRVRDVHGLLTGSAVEGFRAGTPQVPDLTALRAWTTKANSPLAAGVRAALGDAVDGPAGDCPFDVNQRAAVAWAAGRCEEALDIWATTADSPAVSYNRGMAYLFLGRPAEAVPELKTAVASLPESSGWAHLAQLYLSLAMAAE